MTTQSTVNALQALTYSNPITRFLADGGSWADAVHMEYQTILIPKWEAQIRNSLHKHSPSAIKHRERVMADLRDAYAYCGMTGDTL
jgi:hypothetical protein